MEFIEDETRPRFLFQSHHASAGGHDWVSSRRPSKPALVISISVSLFLFASAIFLFQSEPFRSISLWLSLSVLLGPFAPLSLTAGDIRVGLGEIVEFPSSQECAEEHVDDSKRRGSNRRLKPKRSEDPGFVGSNSNPSANRNGWISGSKTKQLEEPRGADSGRTVVEEKEWNEGDVELLRKQIVKHPVGKPRRWEVIAEAFNGRHSVQSVIKMVKSLGESKPEDSESYSKFLRNRKPLDKRAEEQIGEESADNGGGWTSAEDIALLNALKAFPKDATMRWEKIAAAVPGKSKAACVKRLAELKRDFRSSKTG